MKLENIRIIIDKSYNIAGWNVFILHDDPKEGTSLLTINIEKTLLEPYAAFPNPSFSIPRNSNVFDQVVEALQFIGKLPEVNKATTAHLEDLRTLLGLKDSGTSELRRITK